MTFTVKLLGLPLTANASHIRKFFDGLEIPDGGVHILGGDDDVAFITFTTDDFGQRALRKDRQRIHDREVQLYASTKHEMEDYIARIKAGLPTPKSRPAAPQVSVPIVPSSTPGYKVGNMGQNRNPAPVSSYQQNQGSAYSWGDSGLLKTETTPASNPNLPYTHNQYQPQPNRYAPPVQSASQPAFSRTPQTETQSYQLAPIRQSQITQETKDEPTYTGSYQQMPMGQGVKLIPTNGQNYGQPMGQGLGSQAPLNGQPPVVSPMMSQAAPVQTDSFLSGLPPAVQEAFAKLPPHLRPPHGVPPPQFRHLFPSLPGQASPVDQSPRDIVPNRPSVPPVQPPQHFRPNMGPPSGERLPDQYGSHEDRSPAFGAPTQNSWRSGGRDESWGNRSPMDRPDVRRGYPDTYSSPDQRDLGPRGVPGPYGPPMGRPVEIRLFFIELSNLPDHLVRPAAIEEFLKPTVPFSVSAVKTVFNSHGAHMLTLIRVDSEADFDRFLTANGYQGIKVRPATRIQFDEAIDGPPPVRPGRKSPHMDRRSPDKRRRSRSPVVRKRRSRSRSPRRRRSRSPKRARVGTGGRQEPNRWCLQMTNVPFKAEPEEIIAWLSERVKPTKVQRTFYADGNASDRWVAEFESESSMERARNHQRIPLNGRSIRMSYIDNDYADEIMAIEDKYGENKKKEFDMKQLAELQLQHLNGTLGPLGVPRFFNNPQASCPQIPQNHYQLNGRPVGVAPGSAPLPPVISAGPREHVGLLGNGPPGGAVTFRGRGGFRGRGRGFGTGPAFNGRGGENVDHHDIEMFASLGISGTVVSCQGFPPNITSSEIVSFFNGFPVDDESIRVKGTSGVAALCIPDIDKARIAVESLNGADFKGNRIQLQLPEW